MENLSAIPAEGLKRGDVVFVKNTGSEIGKETHVVCGDHPAVIIQNQKGNIYSPNLIVAYAWIEDMLLIMNKISEPVYRDLALKQLKCIAETVSRSDENSCKLLN